MRRSRNSITSGKLWPVSTCMTGNGKGAGRKAFSARRSSTIESLPPEKSSTGRSRSAATSRMMWIASLSSARRWLSCGRAATLTIVPSASRYIRSRLRRSYFAQTVSMCRPHSVFSVPAQRPSRPFPGSVQGAHPIDA